MSGAGESGQDTGAAAAAAVVPAVVTGAAGADAGAATGAETGAAAQGSLAWVQPRIDQLTRERHEERRLRETAEAKAAAAEAALEEIRRGAGTGTGTGTGTGAAEDTAADRGTGRDRMITLEEAERLADARAANRSFAEKTQKVYLTGKEQFKEGFDTALRGLQNVGFGDNVASRQLVEAAMETENPAAVLHELGQDLTNAGQILQLGPAQMGIRLASIAAKVKEKGTVKVSGADEPIPGRVGGGNKTSGKDLYNTEDTSVRDWIAERNKTARKRRR